MVPLWHCLTVVAEDWVAITVVCVLVNRGWRVEEVVTPGTRVWEEPGRVEDRRGEKPEEVVMAEEESETGLEEKPGIAEAEEAPGTIVRELSYDIGMLGDLVLL